MSAEEAKQSTPSAPPEVAAESATGVEAAETAAPEEAAETAAEEPPVTQDETGSAMDIDQEAEAAVNEVLAAAEETAEQEEEMDLADGEDSDYVPGAEVPEEVHGQQDAEEPQRPESRQESPRRNPVRTATVPQASGVFDIEGTDLAEYQIAMDKRFIREMEQIPARVRSTSQMQEEYLSAIRR